MNIADVREKGLIRQYHGVTIASIQDPRPPKPRPNPLAKTKQPEPQLPKGAKEWAPKNSDGWVHWVFSGETLLSDERGFPNLLRALEFAKQVPEEHRSQQEPQVSAETAEG